MILKSSAHGTFHWFHRDAEEGQPQRSKKELIALAKEIAAASKEVSAYSAKIAKNCPDKRVGQVRNEQRGKVRGDSGICE